MTPPQSLLHPTRVSALLAVVVVALAWAGNVTAGCGDHVVILKPAGAAKADDTPPPAKPPCHGPHCSAEPANPLPAPVTSGTASSPTAKEQFTPLASEACDDRQSLGVPFEFTSTRPMHRAKSIFHPPRA